MVTSINEVDQNVDYLTNFVTDTSSSMVEMSASIAQVESNAARSYDLALAVADAAESGMKAVRETIDGMEQIRHSVAESNAVVSRLGDRSIGHRQDPQRHRRHRRADEPPRAQRRDPRRAGGRARQGLLRRRRGDPRSFRAHRVVDARDREPHPLRAGRSRQRAAGRCRAGTKLVEDGVSLSHEAGKALNNILESSTKASEMGKEIAARHARAGQGKRDRHALRRPAAGDGQRRSTRATTQQAQGSDHIMNAVESMREVTKYVRQAMVEQRSGSSMISAAAERMIDMIHEIFQVAASQSTESEKIVATMEQVRAIAEGNRTSAVEMSDSLTLLNDAIRSLDEEVRKFRSARDAVELNADPWIR